MMKWLGYRNRIYGKKKNFFIYPVFLF